MKPVISYYGGKQRLAARICGLLPPHTVYAEPFAGGLAVLFHKGRPQITNIQDYAEMINDHDERLITLYRVCQDTTLAAELWERLRFTPYSRAEFERARGVLENPQNADQVTRAWAYYVQAMMSFSNRLLGGWRTSVKSSNLAQSWDNAVERVSLSMERLRGVHIECKPALEAIRIWDSPQTCFYCDPPYIGAVQGHYGGYTQTDFEALLNLLDNIKGSFVLSCYDNPALPKHWKHVTIKVRASSASSGVARLKTRDKTRAPTEEELGDRERTEHLLVVDRSKHIRSDLKRKLDYIKRIQDPGGTWGLERVTRPSKVNKPRRVLPGLPEEPYGILDMFKTEE